MRTPSAGVAYGLLSEAEKAKFTQKAALEHLPALPTLEVSGTEFHIVHHDSTPIVWDGYVQGIAFSRLRLQFLDSDGPPTTERLISW